MMIHVGIHLTLGSKVCFVALEKNRISVFPVTQARKTSVILVYYKDQSLSLRIHSGVSGCTHVAPMHVCICTHFK